MCFCFATTQVCSVRVYMYVHAYTYIYMCVCVYVCVCVCVVCCLHCILVLPIVLPLISSSIAIYATGRLGIPPNTENHWRDARTQLLMADSLSNISLRYDSGDALFEMRCICNIGHVLVRIPVLILCRQYSSIWLSCGAVQLYLVSLTCMHIRNIRTQ